MDGLRGSLLSGTGIHLKRKALYGKPNQEGIVDFSWSSLVVLNVRMRLILHVYFLFSSFVGSTGICVSLWAWKELWYIRQVHRLTEGQKWTISSQEWWFMGCNFTRGQALSHLCVWSKYKMGKRGYYHMLINELMNYIFFWKSVIQFLHIWH